MAEGMNVEVAHKLTEHEQRSERRNARWQEAVGIIEVALLALVAIATAWSGYQAAKWDGQQSELYGHATTYRFKADAASTYGGQLLAADASIFTAYLQAHAAGDVQLEQLYIRRFTPDYKTAFVAWLRTDPFTNPSAPAGPGVMPQYHNPYFVSADNLNAQASATFEQGNRGARHRRALHPRHRAVRLGALPRGGRAALRQARASRRDDHHRVRARCIHVCCSDHPPDHLTTGRWRRRVRAGAHEQRIDGGHQVPVALGGQPFPIHSHASDHATPTLRRASRGPIHGERAAQRSCVRQRVHLRQGHPRRAFDVPHIEFGALEGTNDGHDSSIRCDPAGHHGDRGGVG